jgi:homoserine kinase
VAGLAGANAWLGAPLSVDDLLQLATEMEGHPDNVAPALYGGITAAFTEGGVTQCLSLGDTPPCSLVAAVPAFELSTAQARKALPDTYSRQDVVANLAAVTILTTVMLGGRIEWLRHGLRDRIHQPYRLALIPGAETVRTAAIEAGAWGVVISGAGPTLLAFCPAERQAAVEDAMTQAWRQSDISSRTLVFGRLSRGVQIEL